MTQRQCFYVPVDQFDDNGYIPSLVTEGEAGHAPLKGNGRFSAPYYWGKTHEQAKEVARKANEDLGLSERDVTDIIASSIRAG
jgi:hypothetical protein